MRYHFGGLHGIPRQLYLMMSLHRGSYPWARALAMHCTVPVCRLRPTQSLRQLFTASPTVDGCFLDSCNCVKRLPQIETARYCSFVSPAPGGVQMLGYLVQLKL